METLNKNKMKTINFYNELVKIDTTGVIGHYMTLERINELNYDDSDEFFDSLYQYLSDNDAFYTEIIFRDEAMEILSENGNLNDALEYAYDFGYKLEGLNHFLLANLYSTENKKQLFLELENDIKIFVEDYKE